MLKDFWEKVRELYEWNWFKEVKDIGVALIIVWILATIAERV